MDECLKGRCPEEVGAKMSLTTKLPRLRPTSGELLHLDLMRFIASAGIVFHHSHEFFVPVTKSPFLAREQTLAARLHHLAISWLTSDTLSRFDGAREVSRWLMPLLKPGMKAGLIGGSR